jgi:hypothetical protein
VQLARRQDLAALSPPAGTRALRSKHAGDGVARADARSVLLAWSAVLTGTVLALYTHNTAPFFVLSLNAGALLSVAGSGPPRWRFALNWVACMAAALLLWAPWLPTLLQQTGTMQDSWKGRAATTDWARDVLVDVFLLGDSRGVLAVALLAFGLFALFALRDRKRLFFACLAFALVGPLVALAVSQVVPIFYRRLLLWAAPPWFALVGAGLAALPRFLPAAALIALLALSQPTLADYYRSDIKPRWRPMLEQLSAQTDERSLILAARSERFLDYYYGRKDHPVSPRKYVHVVSKSRPIERYVKDAAEFYVVGQTQERVYKDLRARISKSRRYKLVATVRHQNAVILKYQLKPGR